jgi:hypothetical protein
LFVCLFVNLPEFYQSNGLYAKLNNSDSDKLISIMLNDTNHLNIQRSSFTNYKLKILSDSLTKMKYYFEEHRKPIFFRIDCGMMY